MKVKMIVQYGNHDEIGLIAAKDTGQEYLSEI